MKINEKNLCVFATTPPYDLEGYLNKRGEVNKAWQKRYFVLKGNLLFYFERKGDKEPLGLIILEGCIIELAEDSDPYSFQIVFNGNRTYILGADSQETMELWMKSLTCAGYEYKKLLLAELQRQLEEIEGSQKKQIQEALQPVAPKPPPRRQNPFNRPAPPPPVLTAPVVDSTTTPPASLPPVQPAEATVAAAVTTTTPGIISMCWLAGTIVGFLPLFGWHAEVGENQACLFVEVMDYNYLVFLYFATIITPALLLLAFYAHIYRVIIRQVRQIVTMNPIGESSRRSSFSHITTSSNRPNGGTMLRVLGAARKRDVKATQNLSVIVLFFMICWIPLYTINCIKAFCPNCYVHPKLTFFCIILSHLNSAVNPVLYAYHLKDFRAALKNLILKILGIEIEQQPDLAYRVSLASQQRLQSIVDKRSSLHSKIYIDSPVWLRQQQQLKDSPKRSAITCSLNSVHQTVAAVASTTTDINRDIWQIPEVSVGAEQASINGKTETSITDNTTYIFEAAVPMERQFSYDNKNFSTSINELDDDVFLPATPMKQPASLDAYFQKDLPESEDLCLNKLPISESNSDYDSFSIVQQNSIVPALSDNSIQTYNPSNGSVLSKDFDGREMSRHNSNSVFMIENDTNLLSPDRMPRIKKISRIPSPFMSKAGRITRSCSCTNDGELTQHSEKFSPLRVVSTIIFPPVKHSSLFHIFDSYKNSDIIGERKRRTSQS